MCYTDNNDITPYLPKKRRLSRVWPNNPYMRIATALLTGSGCVKQPTAAIIVKFDQLLGKGTNAGIKIDGECPRVTEGYKTGEGYGLCKSACKQEGHAEIMAIKDAVNNGFTNELKGASIYLDGHWWICENCWKEIIQYGIAHVYLRVDSMELYKK